MYIFSLNPPVETEYGKSTIAVSKLEVYNSVFNLCEHKKFFTVWTPGYWEEPDNLKTLEQIRKQWKVN